MEHEDLAVGGEVAVALEAEAALDGGAVGGQRVFGNVLGFAAVGDERGGGWRVHGAV